MVCGSLTADASGRQSILDSHKAQCLQAAALQEDEALAWKRKEVDGRTDE